MALVRDRGEALDAVRPLAAGVSPLPENCTGGVLRDVVRLGAPLEA